MQRLVHVADEMGEHPEGFARVNAFDVPRRTRVHSRIIWTISVVRAPGSAKS